MRRIIFFLFFVLELIGVFALFSLERTNSLDQTRYYSSPLEFRPFYSYEELKSFVKAGPKNYPENGFWRSGQISRIGGQPSIFASASPEDAAANYVPEYSTTNVQVEGVDEADVVKTDGEFVYVVSEQGFTILKAYPPEEAEILSQMWLDGRLRGAFINGDKLVIFEEKASKNFIRVYDITDRRKPTLANSASFDGDYFNSRMIGDYVYVLVNKPAYSYKGEISLPKVYLNNKTEEIPASEIYYTDVSDYSYTFTTIAAMNIYSDEEPSHKTLLLGSSCVLYVSMSNIYVAFREVDRTFIYRVHIEQGNIDIAASCEVPGYILNQFSMDEHEEYFRVATTTGHVARTLSEASSRNHVYVLDMQLNVAGRLENLAPGERIYSARFMGDRCYLVTFKKVDPLFVIDLKYPDNPVVLGELKITGYSDYLHPYDENHVIGIGKETVAADEGDFAWYQGVKISLFDVSDVDSPRELAKYEIGDRGTDSPVLRDHKALLFDKSKNLLVMPVLVAEIDEEKFPQGVPPNAHGENVWQGAFVFDISIETGISLKGKITHKEDEVDIGNSGSHSNFVKRSLYIDDTLYTISSKKIKMNSLENLDEVNEIEFS